MRRRSAIEFQRTNSRRLWTAVFFLFVLLVFALVSASYFVASMLTNSGGTAIIQEIGQSAQCGRDRLLPTAAAIDRYARGTGDYPETLEQLLPNYLGDKQVLRCPADTTTPAETPSFLYYRPHRGDTNAVVLECPHHPNLRLRVRARGTIEPGKTAWELQMQPLGRNGQAGR